jgi:hypothetical protein
MAPFVLFRCFFTKQVNPQSKIQFPVKNGKAMALLLLIPVLLEMMIVPDGGVSRHVEKTNTIPYQILRATCTLRCGKK